MSISNDIDALRKENEILRDFFENAPDMFVCVCAETRTIKRCNDTLVRVLGWQRDEIVGNSIFSVYHPDCLKAVEAAFLTFQQTGAVHSNELSLLTKSGGKIPVSLRASSVKDDKGRILYSRSVWRDLTNYLRLKARLVDVQHAESLATLAGGIAHDFNNLLAAILGNAELVKSQLAENSPEVQNIRNIELASVRAAELTKQMLAYAGKGCFEFLTIDLRELGEIVSSTLSSKIEFEYKLGEQPVIVEADVTQVRQFVMNLISNAADSIGKGGGKVQIRTGIQFLSDKKISLMSVGGSREAGEYAFIEVVDNGCGMSPETVGRMFAPFFSTKLDEHHGLGLAATHGIVAQHEGLIDVHSGVGTGTKVQVFLPFKKELRLAIDDQPQRAKRSYRGVVLAIDDDELVRDVVCKTLESANFRVLSCSSGCAALDIFRECEGEIDVILLDLKMPGMDGHETLREVRLISSTVPVILMSGYNEYDAFHESGHELVGFLQKPFRAEELASTIAESMR